MESEKMLILFVTKEISKNPKNWWKSMKIVNILAEKVSISSKRLEGFKWNFQEIYDLLWY